ncbi:hypothetical protein [Nonomuraea dietziae]|uniref:hypothetical protein n=1 Tax=Nonomuraea dietziae TaxID=65515 RepID=UPI003440987E
MRGTPTLVGDQTPRIRSVPPYTRTSGPEVAELAASAGLVLDPWERNFLDDALAEDDDGKWVCFECGIIVSRQNGKGAIFEARILGGLFLFDERLLLYSAHEFKTATEMFLRVKALIDNTDDLRRRVRRIMTANGDEGVELLSGARLRFIARSRGSGRGFSGDLNILDEAFKLGPSEMAALLPTMSARPNPQLYYGSSAGFEDSYQLGSVRARGMAGGDPSLCFVEHSAPDDTLKKLEGKPLAEIKEALADRRLWAMANPALGIRITEDFVAKELRTLPPEEFARERLGVGTYPTEGETWAVIPEEAWRSLADVGSAIVGAPAFAIDVNPERSAAAIAAAGRRPDGRLHVEVIDHRGGTGWVVDRVVELIKRWKPVAVVLDAGGPAGSLVGPLEGAGVKLVIPTARELGQGCGQLYDTVAEQGLRHLDQPPLTAALAGAEKRPLSDAWAWARRGLSVDICPLVAVTEAAWAYQRHSSGDYNVLDSVW